MAVREEYFFTCVISGEKWKKDFLAILYLIELSEKRFALYGGDKKFLIVRSI